MARNIINRGTSANDGTGDTLRDATDKINANFREIYQKFGQDSTTFSASFSLSKNSNGGDVLLIGGDTGFITAISAPSSTAARAITFPNATGTIVLENTTNTLTNKTLDQGILDSATINNPLITSNIFDANYNEIIGLQSTASAVNHVSITNAATSNPAAIAAVGGDTNIGLSVRAKGTGVIRLESSVGYGYSSLITTTGTTLTLNKSLFLFQPVAGITATIPNGTFIGQTIKLINISTGANNVTFTPTTFANGTTLVLNQYGNVELTWVGTPSGWHVAGVDTRYSIA